MKLDLNSSDGSLTQVLPIHSLTVSSDNSHFLANGNENLYHRKTFVNFS